MTSYQSWFNLFSLSYWTGRKESSKQQLLHVNQLLLPNKYNVPSACKTISNTCILPPPGPQRIYSQKSQAQNLQKANQQFQKENQQLQKENQQLQKENQQLQKENQQLQKENQQLQKEKQELQKENQQLQKEKQQLQEEKQQIQEENQQLHEEKQQLHEEKQHLHDEENKKTQKLQEEKRKLYENVKLKEAANQKQVEEYQELQEKFKELQKENQRFREHQQANHKGSAQSHEDISYEFQDHYDYMEKDIPSDLGIKGVANKQEFWKKCCHLYQTSYDICYKEICSVFHEALTSIMRLSKEEEECGEVMFSRQKNLINAKAAYQYLLKQCTVQLSELDKTPIVTKVLESFNAVDHEWLQEEAETAVEICWKMQTVSPPMFLCQPTKHNESWHETHNKSWHEGPGELIYYRPVVMYSAGGIVASKGFIGKTSDESNVISPSKEDVCTTQTEKKAICGGCQMECQGTQEIINHNGKYWHEECLTICSKCKKYVDINESRKSGKHHYHYDCFKCHHCCNTIPTSDDSHSLPDGSIIWCNGCYHKLCLCCHNEIRRNESHCGSCIHKISRSICFECNKKVEVHEKSKTNHGIVHKTCICNCQGAPHNHLKICSKCNKKRY